MIDCLRHTTNFTSCARVRFAATRCSALRAKDALRPAKRVLGFAGLGQALRAHLRTQVSANVRGISSCAKVDGKNYFARNK